MYNGRQESINSGNRLTERPEDHDIGSRGIRKTPALKLAVCHTRPVRSLRDFHRSSRYKHDTLPFDMDVNIGVWMNY